MIAAWRGPIVTTSSVNSFLPDPAVIDYSASKAALANFCKSLSKEGWDRTESASMPSARSRDHSVVAGDDGGSRHGCALEWGQRRCIVGAAGEASADRVGSPHPNEVADLVVFLASDRAANITGDFVIDGGLITTL